jgi:hypothetical protein
MEMGKRAEGKRTEGRGRRKERRVENNLMYFNLSGKLIYSLFSS